MRLGQTAIVTGAARGIGRAIATRFASERAHVFVSDIADDDGARLVSEIQAAGGSATYFHCDVQDVEAVSGLVEAAAQATGQIDILVNNAGGAIVAGAMLPLEETSNESIIRMLNVNLMGTIWCTKAVLPHMRAQRHGSIVNLSSVAGMRGGTPAMYGTAKGAIVALTKSIAVEMAPYDVTVNCVSPWAIATREGPAKLPTRIGRKGTAEEVAGLVAFLASDEARFITGSNYVIDGGWTSGC